MSQTCGEEAEVHVEMQSFSILFSILY